MSRGSVLGKTLAWLRNAVRAARDQLSASERCFQRISGNGVKSRATGRKDADSVTDACPSTIVAGVAETGPLRPIATTATLIIPQRNIARECSKFA